jgi:hypothetical protein
MSLDGFENGGTEIQSGTLRRAVWSGFRKRIGLWVPHLCHIFVLAIREMTRLWQAGTGYSIFGIGADRSHAAKWLFPQEIATFHRH